MACTHTHITSIPWSTYTTTWLTPAGTLGPVAAMVCNDCEEWVLDDDPKRRRLAPNSLPVNPRLAEATCSFQCWILRSIKGTRLCTTNSRTMALHDVTSSAVRYLPYCTVDDGAALFSPCIMSGVTMRSTDLLLSRETLLSSRGVGDGKGGWVLFRLCDPCLLYTSPSPRDS